MSSDPKPTQTVVLCPTCEKPVAWGQESPWRPFCSERCRLIDLGEWLEENHRIADPEGSAQAFSAGDDSIN